jgi:hypothetical protein
MIRPMLDDLELPQVQEITTYDRRSLTELKPPGMAGNLVQNLGRRPERVMLWGVATDDALGFSQKLDAKFRAAKAVPFVADIVADAKLDLVLVEDLRLQELAGKPQRFSYVLTLREFIKPVDPVAAAAAAAAVDTDIVKDAVKHVKDLLDVVHAAGALAIELEQFIPIFAEILASILAFSDPEGHPMADVSKVYDDFLAALEKLQSYIDPDKIKPEDFAALHEAIKAVKKLAPQLGTALVTLVTLLTELQTAIDNLNVPATPAFQNAVDFIAATQAVLVLAEVLLPQEKTKIDQVLGPVSAAASLPSVTGIKDKIHKALAKIITALNTLNT